MRPRGKNQIPRQIPHKVNSLCNTPARQAGQAVAATTTTLLVLAGCTKIGAGWIVTVADWPVIGAGWPVIGADWYTVVCGPAGASALYGGGWSTRGEAALGSSKEDFSILGRRRPGD